MKNQLKTIIHLIILILFVGVGYTLLRYIFVPFTFVACFQAVSILLAASSIYVYIVRRKMPFVVSIILRGFVLTVTMAMSMIMANTYFSAKEDVYENVDHHAFCLDGYQLNRNGGILYGFSPDAILEDTLSIGNLHYSLNYSNDSVSSVTLTADRFGKAIFVLDDEAFYLNKNEQLVSFSDSVTFDLHEDGLISTLNFCVNNYEDSAIYRFSVSGDSAVAATSGFKRKIQKGYELPSLIPTAAVGRFGSTLEGISVLRNTYRRDDKEKVFSQYPFILERDQRAVNISVRAAKMPLDQPVQVELKPGQVFYIGVGTGQHSRFMFTSNGELRYILPVMRPLAKEDKATVMHVSSDYLELASSSAKKFNLCYPLFQTSKNRNNFGFDISYVVGTTHQSLTFHDDIQNRDYQAGESYFVRLASGHNAIFHLENWKESTFFQPLSLWRTLLILSFCA